MKGVLLINMGGPESPRQTRLFLKRMFNDPFILPFSKTARWFLSRMISSFRYRKSWKKYQLIGGTPIVKATQKTVQKLQQQLGASYKVGMGFSYSPPLLNECRSWIKEEEITSLTIIPLYPQSSFSTTSSVKAAIDNLFPFKQDFSLRFIKEFYQHRLFIQFWSELISKHITDSRYTHPFLLFSAHSIPKDLQDRGDTYPWAIAESANLIAKNLGLPFDFAYQSGMKRGEWLGPDVKEKIKDVAGLGKNEIIIIPISFVNENLETLYDLDLDVIPFAKTELGLKSISRVKIPEASATFIDLLTDLVKA